MIAEWQTVAAFHRALTTPMTTVLAPSKREADIVSVLAEADVLFSASFTRAMAAAAPKLRLIQTPGAGLEQIDVAAVPPGVSVCNVYGHERGIAEYVVMTMAALNRDLVGMNRRLRSGDWRDAADDRARLRVVVDQVASLTDISALSWHTRLCLGSA